MRIYILLVIFLLTACSHAPSASNEVQLVIVGTNDFHGYLRPRDVDLDGQKLVAGGADWFAGYVNILKKHYGERLIMLDGGDLFQGTIDSNTSLGASTMKYYNTLPYRAAAIGNHEFDYGPRTRNDPDRLGTLKDRMAEAHFPFLSANILWKKTGDHWTEPNLKPSTIIEVEGIKIGIVGLTTVTTTGKTLPQNIQDLDFRPLKESTEAEIKSLRAKGAEVILAVAHEGWFHPGEELYEMLKTLPAGSIDAFVAGHTHTEIHELVNGVPVIESKTQGLYFGRIDLYFDKQSRKLVKEKTKIHPMSSICGSWMQTIDDCDGKKAKEVFAKNKAAVLPLRKPVYEGEEVQADQKVQEILAPFFGKVEEIKKEVLGSVDSDFKYHSSKESDVGFLYLDAFHWKFPKAKVIYLNGGSFRRMLTKGPVTYGDLYEVNPFDNFVVITELTGKKLRTLATLGVSGGQMLPVIQGIKVKYHDSTDAKYLRDINNDGKKEQWESDRLVTLTWDNGKPVKDSDKVWVATTEYLTSGGDHSGHIFGDIPASKLEYFPVQQRDVAADFLREHKNWKMPTPHEFHIEAVP